MYNNFDNLDYKINYISSLIILASFVIGIIIVLCAIIPWHFILIFMSGFLSVALVFRRKFLQLIDNFINS
jgi:hypothetical protein